MSSFNRSNTVRENVVTINELINYGEATYRAMVAQEEEGSRHRIRPRSIVVLGPPGSGKTSAIEQLAARLIKAYPERLKNGLRSVHAATSDLTVPGGMDLPKEHADGSITLVKALSEVLVPNSIWYLDEIASITDDTLLAAFSKVLFQDAGSPLDFTNVFIIASGNNVEDNAGARELLDHNVSRVRLFQLKPSKREFVVHAASEGWHPFVLSWINFLEEAAIYSYPEEPGEPYVCPRSLEDLAWHQAYMPEYLNKRPFVASIVGRVGSGQYMEHVELIRSLPPEEDFIAGKVPVYDKIGLQYAATQRACRIAVKNANARRIMVDFILKHNPMMVEASCLTIKGFVPEWQETVNGRVRTRGWRDVPEFADLYDSVTFQEIEDINSL